MRPALLCCLLLGCGGAPQPHPMAPMTVPPLPDWTDRYSDSKEGDARAFQIEALMAAHDLTRLQAVELQNLYRDQSRATPNAAPQAMFDAALAQVRKGELESGLDQKALDAAPFIVVFDLDDTIYDQYRTNADCADVTFTRADGKPKHIKFAPGWDATIKRIRAAGGLVVFFSANLDEPTRENLRQATLDGKPLLDHPDIAGVLTNSYLVLQTKHEGDGKENPRKGQPVLEPSKDLRLFDPSLERVVIVDDNPLRLFQYANTRLFKKFHADAFCTGDDRTKAAYAQAMQTVADEIIESIEYARANQATFRDAYLPYSYLGRVAVDWLAASPEFDADQAREHLRRHPDLADSRF